MAEKFEVLSEISDIETIAAGPSLRMRRFLQKSYGRGNWRKLEGYATVRLVDGFVAQAELHWYEAHGRGRVDVKIKRMLKQEP